MSTMTDDFARERARWGSREEPETLAWEAARVARVWSKDRPKETAVFLRDALDRLPNVAGLVSAAAWNSYRAELAPLPEPQEMTSDRADAAVRALSDIQRWTAEDPYGQYSALPRAVVRTAKALERWPERRLAALALIDPMRVPDETDSEYGSLRRSWFLQRTKALLDAERWTELHTACTSALASLTLDAKAQGWFIERRARALLGLKRYEEAAEILRQHVVRNRNWWVRHGLAQALVGVGDTAGAIAQLRLALVDGHDLAKRWRVLVMLAELISGTERELAAQHLALARQLRAAEGWPADDTLESTAKQLDAPEAADRRLLKDYWNAAEDPSASPRLEGTIDRVLDGEGSGFLTPDGAKEALYFSMGRGKTAPPVGTRVSFNVVDSFDQKKQRPSQRAVGVKEIG
jgi:hypothetical protein